MALPLLVLSVDVNGIGTVLPQVQTDLSVPTGSIGWLVSTTSLTMAATLIPVGLLAPRLGNRRLVLIGVSMFGLASLVCGVAPGFWILVTGRVGQGLGGVLMYATSLAVINAAFDDRRRPAAIGAWGLINGAGGALGPLIAGIATTASWRVFFLINVPLCLVAVPLMFRLTPKDHLTSATKSFPSIRLGLLGAALIATTWAFQNTADEGWLDPGTVAAFVFAAFVFGGLLVAHQRGREAVLSIGVTRSRRFVSANVMAFSANWGFGVTIIAVGVYLQRSLGKSPFESGLIFTSFSVAVALAGLCISFIHKRLGLVTAMAAGMVVVSSSLAFGAVVLTPSAPLVVITIFLILAGFGQGLAFDLSTLASLDDVPETATAEAASVIQVVRSMGFTIGIALSTTLTLAVTTGIETPATVAHGVSAVLAMAAVIAMIGIGGSFLPNFLRRSSVSS